MRCGNALSRYGRWQSVAALRGDRRTLSRPPSLSPMVTVSASTAPSVMMPTPPRPTKMMAVTTAVHTAVPVTAPDLDGVG
jgi:hypothetical protein